MSLKYKDSLYLHATITRATMCILFAYINNDAQDGEFQLVLANNRDEFYDRPTAPAARWQHDPACISGMWVDCGY